MSEETTSSAVVRETSPSELADEAKRYNVPLEVYEAMSARERRVVRATYTRKIKSEAKRLGFSADWWMSLSDEERKRERTRRLNEIAGKHSQPETSETTESEEFRVYTEDPDVPPGERDPLRRDGMTIGKITEFDPPPDVLGNERERNPRTLMDLYHRWPVGDGEHFIRVERIQPKQWQQVPCAGYLGDIREPIPEKKFQQFFGGREYELTLYGPDPTGKLDPNTGLPRIKALTNPIKVTVPVLPPNLAVLPAMLTNNEAKQEAEMTQPWNPFAPAAVAVSPTTPADAQVHKSNVDLVTNVLRMTQEENRELRKAREQEGAGTSKQLLDWQRDVLEGVRKDAEARERILREELAEARRIAEKKEEEIEKIRQQVQAATGRTDGTTLELVKALGTSGAERDAQRAEYYRQQIDALRASHQDILRAAEERHRQEIGRQDERMKELDAYYRRLFDDMKRQSEEREKTLKEEIDRVRRDERDAAEARVRELKERYEERLRDQEKSFERELRTAKENWETKLSTSVATKDFEIATLRDRLEEAREEAAEARSKAEENNDPIVVMEKAKKNAEALGYAKVDDAPKTPWERFAATAGAGLGHALQNIDQWLPQAAAAIGGRNAPQQGAVQGLAAPPQLTAAASAARAVQPPQRTLRPRAVAWAASGQPPVPPEAPEVPIGFQAQASPAPPVPDAPSRSPVTDPVAPQAHPAPPSPPQQHNGTAVPPRVQVPNQLGKVFGDDAVMQFLQQLDLAINMGMEPSDFASRFISGYREAAVQMVTVYKPEDVSAFVTTLPGADRSAILRRDGSKFLTGLWAEIKKQTGQSSATAQA
jgi:hypothetical protein